MTDEFQDRTDAIFAQALGLQPSERTAYVREACGGDQDLLAEVEALLEVSGTADAFFADFSERIGISALLHADNDDSPPAIGQAGLEIGSYRLCSLIATGGMGAVWRAERSDGRFEGVVAVKLLTPNAGGMLAERFDREVQFLAQLTHPNIARLLDAGVTDPGQAYLVLEFVDGMSIDKFCDKESLPLEGRLEHFLAVLDAVAHAHANLIVHRDIKPGNVMVSRDHQVKLLDFGVAKLLRDHSPPAASGLTQQYGSALTPEFAAPEQLLGEAVTTATDVYSLGLLLYVILTGVHPRPVHGIASLGALHAALEREPPQLADAVRQEKGSEQSVAERSRLRDATPALLQRSLNGDLDNILRKALDRRPDHRYSSVTAFADDLRRYMRHEPVTARPDTVTYRIRKFIRRNRVGVASVATVLLTLVLAVAITTTQMIEARQQRDRAEVIQGFLVELFEEADPNQSKGAEITAREILDRGANRIERNLTGQTRVQADLLETIGGIYVSLSMFDRAAEYLEESLTLRLESGGMQASDHAAMLETLSAVYESQGNYNESERMALTALEIRRREGEPAGTARAALRLGSILHRRTDLDAAEQLYREALRLLRANSHEDSPLMPRALHQFGSLLAHRGQFADALKLHEEGLATRRALVGDEHLDLIESYYNLGSVEADLGRYDDAKQHLEHALAITRKLTPAGNADAPYMVNALATVHDELGEYYAAEARFQEALDLLRQHYEPDHPNIGIVSANLGLMQDKIGKSIAAKATLQSAFDIMQESLPDHPKMPSVRIALGQAMTEQRDYEAAEEMLLAALATLQDSGRGSSGSAEAAATALVTLYTDWGRTAEADYYRTLLPGAPDC